MLGPSRIERGGRARADIPSVTDLAVLADPLATVGRGLVERLEARLVEPHPRLHPEHERTAVFEHRIDRDTLDLAVDRLVVVDREPALERDDLAPARGRADHVGVVTAQRRDRRGVAERGRARWI